MGLAWVDYQKAYDSVPHSWLLQRLEMHKISPVFVQVFVMCDGELEDIDGTFLRER